MVQLLKLRSKLLTFFILFFLSNANASAWLIPEHKKLFEFNLDINRFHLNEYTDFDPHFIKKYFDTEIPKDKRGVNDRDIYQSYFNLVYTHGVNNNLNLGFNLRFNSEFFEKADSILKIDGEFKRYKHKIIRKDDLIPAHINLADFYVKNYIYRDNKFAISSQISACYLKENGWNLGIKLPIAYRWINKHKIRFIEFEPEFHITNIHNTYSRVNFKFGWQPNKFSTRVIKISSNLGKRVNFADLDMAKYNYDYSLEILQIYHLNKKMNLNFSVSSSLPRYSDFQMLGIMVGMDLYF